jgi:hypothetical protein
MPATLKVGDLTVKFEDDGRVRGAESLVRRVMATERDFLDVYPGPSGGFQFVAWAEFCAARLKGEVVSGKLPREDRRLVY